MARKPINFAKGRRIVDRYRKRQAREEFLARGPERFTDIPKYLFQSSVERGKAQAVTGLLGQSLGSAVLQSRSARPGQRFKEFKSLVVDRTLGSMGIVGDVIRAKSRGRFDDNVTKGTADEKFEAIRNKFLGINDAVKVIDENFNKVNKRIEKLEKNAVELKNLNGLVKSVEDLNKKFDVLDNKVDKQFSDFDTKFRLIMREMNQQSERVNVRGMTPRDQVVSGGGTGTGSGDILSQLLNSLLPSTGTVARGGAASAAALATAKSAKLKAAFKALSSVVARTAPGAARFGARFGPIGALSVGLGPNETDILNDIKDLEKAIGKDSKVGVSDAITRIKQKVDFSTRNTADKNITQIQKAFKNTNLPLMERGRLAIQNANQKFKKSSDPSYRKSAISSLMSDLNSLNITERQKQQLLNTVGPGIRNELDRMASRKKRANRRIISGKNYGTMGDDIDFGGGIPSSVGNVRSNLMGAADARRVTSKTSTGQRIGGMPTLSMRDSSRGQLDFQSQFLRQQIEQQKSQFLKFGQLPPGFEFVQGNMGRLGSAQAVAARGAMPLMGMGSGGMGMPSYGGRAVSSGMGYGSSSPGYDTGGAQNFGIESQDITIPTSGGKKGMIDRRQFVAELKNPRVKELFFTMMQAEVGSQGKKSQIAFAETVFNRATVEGKSLEGILSNRKYYEPYKNGAFNRARRSMNDSKRNSYAEILGIVQGGSDITKGATHNASAGVAASVKRGAYDSIRNSIIDIGGETYYRKTYEQKRFNARIKRFTEDQPQSGQQQGVNQQIPRTGVNVNQSQVGVYQPSQQSYARSGAGTINFKEGERHRGTVLHDAGHQTLEKQLEFQSGGLGNRSRLGYAAVITKDGRVVETANPGQLTYHTKGKTSSGLNVNRNFTSIGFIGGFSKEGIDRAVESGELARFFARRPGSLEQLTTHSQIVRDRGSHVHGGGDRERVGYHGGRGEATPQLEYIRKKHLETLRQQVEGYRSQRREPQQSSQAPVTGQQNISPNVGRVVQKQMEVAGIRKRPISNKLEKVLRYASQQSGAEVVIFSGGQRGKHEHGHGKRTGSTRHDYGHAADLDLFVTEGGKRRRLNPRNEQDSQIMQKFVFAAAQAGATGVGHGSGYMGTGRLHVGFGKVATWGGGMESTGFNSAFYEGRKNQIDLNKINLNAPTEEQQSNLQTDRKVVQSQNGHRTHFDQGREPPSQQAPVTSKQQAPVTSNISRQVTAQGTGPGTLAGVLKRGAQIGGVGPIRHGTFRGLCGKGTRGIVGALLNESHFRKGLGTGGSPSAGSLSFNNNYLQASGFYQDRQMVDKSKFTKEFMESLPIGTVVSSAAERGKGHGHVQVKLANGKWASDALQNGVLLSSRYKNDGYAIHIPNAKGFEKLNPSIVGQHQPTLDAMQNIGVKVKPPTQQEQRMYQQEQQGPGMAGRETPLQFHTKLYGNIAEVSKTSGFSQNQLAAILGVPSTQKFEQYRARQAEEKRKQQLGRKALGQFTQAEINAARQDVPGPMETRRPETDQEVRQRLTKAAINEVAAVKQEDRKAAVQNMMSDESSAADAAQRMSFGRTFAGENAQIEAQRQSEQRAAAQRMMVPGVSDVALAQSAGRNAFPGENAQIVAQRQLLEKERQEIFGMDKTMIQSQQQSQQAQMMNQKFGDFAISSGTAMANRVASEANRVASDEEASAHPLAGMGNGKEYGEIGEPELSLPPTPQAPVNEFADFKEASKRTASNIGDIGDAIQESEKAQNTELMTGGLDDANVAQKASDAANEVKEKQAKGSTVTSKSQKSSSGPGTGGSRGGSGGTNHPESEPASPGSGGYGSYGRCFV